ncbi:uncharacterized protein G2W53_032726 [Senna tora]|uniref:Uncharacterized protein n=1 Tax=Senna tora TaxID=362788 RepID=A0A834SWY7_9FABA|nr:uncharacterized protein G2W53_032726 [Senna tora]
MYEYEGGIGKAAPPNRTSRIANGDASKKPKIRLRGVKEIEEMEGDLRSVGGRVEDDRLDEDGGRRAVA